MRMSAAKEHEIIVKFHGQQAECLKCISELCFFPHLIADDKII